MQQVELLLRALHTKNNNYNAKCNNNDVSIHTDEWLCSVNGGAKHTLHALTVSAHASS